MKKLCTCCGSEIFEVFNLGYQPLANKYPKSKKDIKLEYIQNMIVYLCDECGYCHVPCDAERTLFFEDYYYLSSVNTELVNHFDNVAEQLLKYGAKFVLDIGSNDGILLKPLTKRGVKCLGIDASQNVGNIANSRGLETFIGFFDKDIAKKVIETKGRPDVIVASSVFTHLSNPGDFFNVCDQVLDENGFILIEVEFLNDIIKTIGFERFYYDRPHYYTVESLKRLSSRHGFKLVAVKSIRAHGGSIQVKFKRSSEISSKSFKKQNKYKSLTRNEIVRYFSSFEKHSKKLKSELIKFKKNGKNIGGYGCPARLSTITNFANIGPNLIPFVVDDTPLKQGRYTPGKHIPIISYAESPPVSNYLVFAYEYIDSIRSKLSLKNVKYFKPVPYTKL